MSPKPRYAKPAFPYEMFERFNRIARKLGYTVRGQRWQLMEKMIENAEQEPPKFQRDTD